MDENQKLKSESESQKPWESEPNFLDWVDDATGYSCAIRRNDVGALCGYVRIDKAHPFFGRALTGLPDKTTPQKFKARSLFYKFKTIRVHGAISYSRPTLSIRGSEQSINIASLNEWWLGFDCAHASDHKPHLEKLIELEDTAGRDEFLFHSVVEAAKAELTIQPDESQYRDIDYVSGKCRELARLLQDVKEEV